MKLITDIPDNTYTDIQEHKRYTDFTILDLIKAIRHSTPIPDDATNGEVIKAMFHDAEIHLDGNDVFFHHMGFWIKCNIRWWNAPYQKGGKE